MKISSFIRKKTVSYLSSFCSLLQLTVRSPCGIRCKPRAGSKRTISPKRCSITDGSVQGTFFFGNSAVTGAYVEEASQARLVEMGMSYGKLTDLKAMLEQKLYHVDTQLVIGIDVHTMLDKLQTDDKYPWLKPWYKPYMYAYGPYFKDAGKEFTLNALHGRFAYQPRWIDKELYSGRQTDEEMNKSQARYNQMFNIMKLSDLQHNIDALQWVVGYAKANGIDLRVIWMPYNYQKFPYPPYIKG